MTRHVTPHLDKRAPSGVWLIAAIAAACVAVTAVALAYVGQQAADRPVGEGELFAADGQAAAELFSTVVDEGGTPGDALRHVRNSIAIGAVSLLGPDGTVVESTSESLLGYTIDNPFLAFALSSLRFGAVATRIDADILIDGVVEWDRGDVLYAVLQPVDDQALLLHYDIEELLGRRARARGIRSSTLVLLGVAGLFMALAALALVGRAHSMRRIREVALEAGLLRDHAVELESKNAELDEARRRAEEALELAEEKNRIRAEFVLMINHELRTPLTSVVTGADMLRSDPLMSDDDRRAVLDTMVADGRRLEEMIGQMLTVARIENRGLQLHVESTGVADIWTRIEGTTPRLGTDGGLPDRLRGSFVTTDPMTLTQLIASLADNALTHGAGTVGIRCIDALPFTPMAEVGTRSRHAVYFVVEDDGPGIDREFLPRIFEKFEKSGFSPGTGLGLYLAKLMVEALECSLSVHTSPEGTSMALGVPRAPVPDLVESR